MKNLTWQNPEQLFVAQELINKVKSKCCGIKGGYGVYAGYTCNRCGGTGEIVADYVETRSSSDVSFKGRSFFYGPCNRGCGCKIYEHAPGHTECVNCATNGCSVTKSYHKKVY